MSERRRELLSIAAGLFAEHGFANVTVDEIGEAAGISGPALYHHFDGKEALLGEMLVDISTYLLDGGTRIADAGGDVIGALIDFHATFAVDRPDLITVHFRDLVHATDADRAAVRSIQNRYVALWVDALRERSPDVSEAEAGTVVHALFGLLNSTPYSARLPRDQMLALLGRLARSALGS